MKVTVVREQSGNLAGGVIGQVTTVDGKRGVWTKHEDGLVAGVVAGPGQSLEEVDVPDQLRELVESDATEFHRRLEAHLAGR